MTSPIPQTPRYLRALITLIFITASSTALQAQAVRAASHLAPTGKGWGVPQQETDMPDPTVQFWQAATRGAVTNGIYYHGGKVMPGTVHLYFIWYGNWTNGPKASDSTLTQSLLSGLFAQAGGVGTSKLAQINTTYLDSSQLASGSFFLVHSTSDNYSRGKSLTDASVQAVVASAIQSGRLPKDSNGIYFVLSSSDVNETSGYCSKYCGWHTHASMAGADIKLAYVGNPDRCPMSCEMEVKSPNGDSGADGMASVMVHETAETITDPDLNGWYDASGEENADKCAWTYGPLHGTMGLGAYNQTYGTHNWLIQMLWENSRGGGCTQVKGGTFYNQ